MNIQQAIQRINDMGFNTNLWSKGGKTRIYITFQYGHFTKECGFIGSDASQVETNFTVRRSAEQKQKDFFADKNEKLSAIANFNVKWENDGSNLTASQKEKNAYRVGREMLHDYHYSSLAERDRIIENGGWELTHDL